MYETEEKENLIQRFFSPRFSYVEITLFILLGILGGWFATNNTMSYYQQDLIRNAAVMILADQHARSLSRVQDPEIAAAIQQVLAQGSRKAIEEIPEPARKTSLQAILTGSDPAYLREIDRLLRQP